MTHDAVVIGAGPAGAVAARELARRGAAVLLVDKAHFPRPKVCGCCVNGAAVKTLQRLGLGAVLAGGVPLKDVRIGAGRRSARVKLPGGVALSREAFDAALVREAVAAGVEFRDGVTAKFDGGAVRINERPVDARVAIVASGLAGNDASPEPGSRIGAGVSAQAGAVPAFFAPGTVFMATARGGYVGCVRVEDGRLDVAAAFDVAFLKGQGGPGPAAEAVLAGVGWPRIEGLAELPWKGTPALTRRAKRLGGARWFAVGDAAGYVEPFTGEGMAWAVTSAAALAPIAARAIQKWDDALVREWESTHRRTIGTRQYTCRVVSRVLRSPALTTLAVRALSVLPILSRPVVKSLNRPSPLRGASP
ncbi:MAG: FAD-dependent monooxygenase [Planctomycetes bacterium]|nr:FAD-dependent monooxygenase [Planctomycetota bacterium]